MARQRTAVRVNQFVGGFNTEANLLSFPEGASFDEENCDLQNNGSRRRRNGFGTDFGDEVNTNVVYPESTGLGRNQFVWRNAGGDSKNQFLVIQLGSYVGFHELTGSIVSENLVYSFVLPGVDSSQSFGMASIDGILVLATGTGAVWSVSYKNGVFTRASDRLLIRDLFGTQAGVLTDPENFQVRPTNLPDTHYYNLRNQTFALPRPNGSEGTSYGNDPLNGLFRRGGIWPSNADNVNFFLIADSNFVSNRTIERFNADSMYHSPPQNNRSPMGYFIIDALERGSSRMEAIKELTDRHPDLQWKPTVTLPSDRTPGGPTTVAQYAGRVWYGGFQGDVLGGDKKSPRLSSYVLFSQVVKETSQIYWCYQQADPTSNIDPDLVATDGGFIKIDEAYNIQSLVPVDSSLFVFAENGIWRIVGSDENAFNATSYVVNKVTDTGCVAANSVIYIDGVLLYWAENGIYTIQKDKVGVWNVANLTDETIKTYYQKISAEEKLNCSGYFDEVTGTLRWLYGGEISTRTEVSELILNKKFQTFTKNRIRLVPGTRGPVTVSGGRLTGNLEVPVTVDGEPVTVGGEVVTTPPLYSLFSPSQNFYCIITQLTPTMKYTFGGYNNEDNPTDWITLGGIDSPAFLTTGFVTGGEGRLRKDVPYLTTYFDILPGKSSALYLQTRWDWTTNQSSGKWTAPRQIYRDIGIRSGDSTVVTKSKIRGGGMSMALNFTSEPGKFFHLNGWEHNLEATTDE